MTKRGGDIRQHGQDHTKQVRSILRWRHRGFLELDDLRCRPCEEVSFRLRFAMRQLTHAQAIPRKLVILKNEISRPFRKKMRSKTERLKKASGQYRSTIAALKRRIDVL